MQRGKPSRHLRLQVELLEVREMLTAVCSSGRDDFTVGLVDCTAAAYDGYTLIDGSTTAAAYLVDIHGRTVNAWTDGPYPGRRGARLGIDGSLVSSGAVANPAQPGGGVTGALYKLDWEGHLTWQWEYATADYTLHHDLEVMPNGNILAFAWVLHTPPELIAAGRNPATIPADGLWGERIIEVQPTGPTTADIVWEWNLIDHVIQDFDATKPNFGVVADHPEKFNVNLGGNTGARPQDWVHINAIDYNPVLDQVLVGTPFLDEFWVIDKSTTTAEAATDSGGNSGKGGDFLYRWGNPGNYGAAGPQQLFGQHDVQWIDVGLPGAGNIMAFNNQATPTSMIIEIVPPVDSLGNYTYTPGTAYGPTAPAVVLDTGINANNVSGAQRQPNGNTLFANGPAGRFMELTTAEEVVWDYISPITSTGTVNQGDTPPGTRTFKTRRYDTNFVGLAGRDLSPTGYVESWDVGDYNLNGLYDGDDLDRLCSGLSTGDRVFDLTFDDLVDLADVEAMVVGRLGTQLGDATLDGVVDVSDFNRWNDNKFTEGTTWSTGDFNCDGFTDVSDFNIWNGFKFSEAAAGVTDSLPIDGLAEVGFLPATPQSAFTKEKSPRRMDSIHHVKVDHFHAASIPQVSRSHRGLVDFSTIMRRERAVESPIADFWPAVEMQDECWTKFDGDH